MLTVVQKEFYIAFLVGVIISLSPFNAIAYFAPFILLIWMALFTNSRVIIRNIVLFLFAVFYLLVLYVWVNNKLVIGNSLLSILTYGAFIPICVIPSKYLNSESLIIKIFRILFIVLFIESILGLIQAFYGFSITQSFGFSNGDFVEGSIHPQLPSERSMSNPIFAIILSTLLIFLFPYKKIFKYSSWSLSLGVVVFILASVNHLILFLILSAFISFIIIRPSFFSNNNVALKFILGTVSITISGLIIKLLLITNLSNVGSIFQSLLINEYPKTQILYTYYNSTKNNIYPFTGIGPGQFISRASFMASGEYFGGRDANKKTIPLTQQSPFFEKYVYKKWKKSLSMDIGSSSSTQIHSSWGAFLTEFGLLLWIILIIYLIHIIRNVKNMAKSKHDRFLAFSLSTFIIYLFLMGIQQNYWEVSQAIFIGLIISKLIYSKLKYQYKIPYESIY